MAQAIAWMESPAKFYDKLLAGTYSSLPKLKQALLFYLYVSYVSCIIGRLGELSALTDILGEGQFLLSRAVSAMPDLNSE